MITRKTAITILLAAAASSATAQSLMLQHGEYVQGVGDTVAAVPGATIGNTSPFSIPVIDINGNMLWRARMIGGGVTTTTDQAMFYGRTAADLKMWLRSDGPEPTGLPGVTIRYSSTGWDAARLSPENRWVLMGTTLAGTGITTANDTAIYRGPLGGQLVLLAQESGPTPVSTAGAILGSLSGAQNVTALNSSGTALFKANMTGGNVVANVSDTAWFIGNPTTGYDIMCRESDVLPGPNGFQVAATLDGFKPTIDEQGRVLFAQSMLVGSGSPAVTASDASTLMLYTPGSGLSILMRQGDPAAGSGGCLYGSISSGSGFCNQGFSRNSGRFVFSNTMTGGDVTSSSNDHGIFAGQIGGSIARIAREAEAAPTGVPGDVYQAFFPNGIAQINDSGTVVFVAQLGPAANMTTATDTAVFLARPPYGPNDVQMVVREGASAATIAGLPTGWVIGNTSGGGMSASGTTLLLNEHDELLINVAGVGDPTQATFGAAAQIAWDPQHGLRLANMNGEVYLGVNTMSNFNGAATSSGDGANLTFTNNGDEVGRVFFTGGTITTGVMRFHVGSLVGIPSAIAEASGGVHLMNLDAGLPNAGQFYAVAASVSGTRPGFPFAASNGIFQIPLNFDWVTSMSISMLSPYPGTPWGTTFGNLDANGRGTATLTIPPSTGFIGLDVHHAFAAFDIGLNVSYVSEPCGMLLY